MAIRYIFCICVLTCRVLTVARLLVLQLHYGLLLVQIYTHLTNMKLLSGLLSVQDFSTERMRQPKYSKGVELSDRLIHIKNLYWKRTSMLYV